MHFKLLNESLFFRIGHARRAIAEVREDFNAARPHSSFGYQTPAAFAETISSSALDKDFASSPVAKPVCYSVTQWPRIFLLDERSMAGHHAADFINVYNCKWRLETLKCALCEYICNNCTAVPDRFTVNLTHQMS